MIRRRVRTITALLAVACIASACSTDETPNTFDPAGPAADDSLRVTVILLVLGTAIFLLFTALILGGGLSKRHHNLLRWGDHRFIAIGGVVLPGVVLAVVAAVTLHYTRSLDDETAPDALRIEVVGHRWWWEIRYPEEEIITANEIHVPTGRDVVFSLTSADVNHSFWVPQMSGKMDLIPGQVNELQFSADEAGTYWGECAEFCGLQHTRMQLLFVAEVPEDYDTWLSQHRTDRADDGDGVAARRGREVFEAQACGACHRVEGTVADGDAGPDLSDIGSRLRIGAGVLANTPENMAEWIRDPHDVKEGVAMPAFPIADDDMAALVAYLEGLDG